MFIRKIKLCYVSLHLGTIEKKHSKSDDIDLKDEFMPLCHHFIQ
jgi:hypothetical protein